MARQGCCGDGTCCEALNVLASLCALLLSIAAAAVGRASEVQLEGGCQGLGPAGDRMQAAFQALPYTHAPVLALNLVAAAAVWLSFFHCTFLPESMVHCLTNSGSLCLLRVIVMLSFLAELTFSQVLLVWRCVLSGLSFLCGTGDGMVSQVQEVVLSARSSFQRDIAAGKSVGKSSLGFAGLFAGLDLPVYCGPSGGRVEEDGSRGALIACLFAVAAQVLMAMALNGEKERVALHEEHEKGVLGLVEREAESVHGLLEKSETFQSVSSEMQKLGSQVGDYASHNAYLKSASDQVHRLTADPSLLQQMTSQVAGSAAGAVSGVVAGHSAASLGDAMGGVFDNTFGGSRGSEMGRQIGQALGSSVGSIAGREAALHPAATAELAKFGQRGEHMLGEAEQRMQGLAATMQNRVNHAMHAR